MIGDAMMLWPGVNRVNRSAPRPYFFCSSRWSSCAETLQVSTMRLASCNRKKIVFGWGKAVAADLAAMLNEHLCGDCPNQFLRTPHIIQGIQTCLLALSAQNHHPRESWFPPRKRCKNHPPQDGGPCGTKSLVFHGSPECLTGSCAPSTNAWGSSPNGSICALNMWDCGQSCGLMCRLIMVNGYQYVSMMLTNGIQWLVMKNQSINQIKPYQYKLNQINQSINDAREW